MNTYQWIDSQNHQASEVLSASLSVLIDKYKNKALSSKKLQRFSGRPASLHPIVFVCIGTPFIPGDSLGPMVGSLLSEKLIHTPRKTTADCRIYGTMADPVHAQNFHTILPNIQKQFENPLVIVVDAAIGNSRQNGYITLKKGPLKPGRGLGKHLPPIGHIQVAGIFQNLHDEHAVSLAKRYCDVISDSFFHCLRY